MKKALKGIFSVAIGLVFSIQAQAQILMERQQIPEQGISLNIPKGFLRMDETMKNINTLQIIALKWFLPMSEGR